jgi:mannobiose 2-epimerase
MFLDYIIDPKTHHLRLFFDEGWNVRSHIVSFGHDIEAAWLLHEAAEVNENALLGDVKKISVKIAEATIEGVDTDGGLWYEYDLIEQELVRQKHSWPQAEAMIGFFNAWKIEGDQKFLKQSLDSWKFIKNFMIDENLGEWYWGVNADHSPMLAEEKVGVWKCPYHNGRSCMQIIRRINNHLNETI